MRIRPLDIVLLTGLLLCASALRAMQVTPAQEVPERISVGSGKTRLMDMPVDIARVSVASPETAEAVPVDARTIMINGRAPGETSLVIWLSDNSRREYDLNVTMAGGRIDLANQQIAGEFGDDVHLSVNNAAVYLTGRVKNLYAAARAESIAATLGKVVDLLKVDVPDQETQILLKVRFADVDRSKSTEPRDKLFRVPARCAIHCHNRSVSVIHGKQSGHPKHLRRDRVRNVLTK